ncbi:glutathione peroxidase-like [Ischnura elegans]|uniref:glutathione peroxidase-like n=1 Tax=Ischnura elegans TaxID=197161 RepID=UPI001ED88D5D|nr:glutathione peroxidase-like [Ischnura elegans]
MGEAKHWLAPLLCLLSIGLGGAEAGDRVASRMCSSYSANSLKAPRNGVYNFTIPDIYGRRNISLSEYQGQSFTHHYLGVNALIENYPGIAVLGIPSNQFGMQEPGSNASEILNGIKHVRPGKGFEPNFPLTAKTEVNGAHEHPLYTYLKSQCPPTRESFSDPDRLFYKPMKNSDVRWNWEKFLIDKNGIPRVRYDPSTEPHMIQHDIIQLQQEPLHFMQPINYHQHH